MNTQLNGQMTIKDYAMRHGVSESTVRRKIKAGALTAERVNGKWYINSEQVDSQVHSQNEQIDDQSALVSHLMAEVEYLRDQLDKQTSLLAATTKQNADLIETLPPPRRSLISRLVGFVRSLFFLLLSFGFLFRFFPHIPL